MIVKIAVLGASGFLGSLISSQLNREHNVTKVSRSTNDLLNFSSVSSWLKKEKFDVIVNCATAGANRVNEVSLDDLSNNISLFMNFYNNSDMFGRFINIGSGAEFDTSTHIRSSKESDILTRCPKTSYGFSKNVISRMCLEKKNFFTLRLFGCFSSSEPEFRILKKTIKQDVLRIQNKKFDFISYDDFYSVLMYYIITVDVEHKDVNCVYVEKCDLVSILEQFKQIHKLTTRIELDVDGFDYTGDGTLLSTLPIKLKGLSSGLEGYI